jgi:hypothetical protein
MLLIGEAQAVAEAICILGHLDRQRCQSQDGIGDEVERGFERSEAVEEGRPGRGGKHERDQPVAQHGAHQLRPAQSDEQAQHLLAHPLGRQQAKSSALGNAGGKALGVGRTLAIVGGQAEEAQDAQVVLADARRRIADEAHAALGEIGIGAERVEHLAVGAAIERVDRKVAPARIGGPIIREGHRGVAAVGLDVLAQRRDLIGDMVGDDRDRAVGHAGRDGGEARRLRRRHHLVRPGRRRYVDIGDGPAQ